jgi:uncharacterized membrane protein YgcG
VAAGEGLSPAQQGRIASAIDQARENNGLDVTVLVGDVEISELGEFRAAAERLHAALGERSATAVLLVVAPGQRRVEVVTGPGIRRRVPDRVAALAVLSMTTSFAGGDLAGGVVDGIRQIADAAGRRPALPPADHRAAELSGQPALTTGH